MPKAFPSFSRFNEEPEHHPRDASLRLLGGVASRSCGWVGAGVNLAADQIAAGEGAAAITYKKSDPQCMFCC